MPTPPESDEPPSRKPRRAFPGPTPATVELLRRFGADFKAARLDAGLSQRQIAAAIDTVRQTVTKVEAGRLNLTVDVMQRLADAVGRELELVLTPRGTPLSARLRPGPKPR